MDMTLCYRALIELDFCSEMDVEQLEVFLRRYSYRAYFSQDELNAWVSWFSEYRHLVMRDGMDNYQRRELLTKTNPAFILRDFVV